MSDAIKKETTPIMTEEQIKSLKNLSEEDFLCLNVHNVRNFAYVLGCPQPTSTGKADNIKNIMEVIRGNLAPVYNNRGRGSLTDVEGTVKNLLLMAKQKALAVTDETVLSQAETGLVIDDEVCENESKQVEANAVSSTVEGVLETVEGGFGFLRLKNYCICDGTDVYVKKEHIQKYRLKDGDWIKGDAKKYDGHKSFVLTFIKEINYIPTPSFRRKANFDDLKAIFPKKRLRLETDNPLNFALRAIDLVSPVGLGQRGLIVSPPKAGKTVLLKSMAQSIIKNHPDVHLMVLLIDERPEEVSDMEYDLKNCEIISSTFDQNHNHQVRVAELALERAKRLVETGKDVVILMDSITRLARAYNQVVASSGRTLTGGLDVAAVYEPKKFFGAARNTAEAGSLTIIATALIDTGSRMDDVIYEEFKGTGNMEIHLDRKLSERRIFPAIDIERSGTRREDLLYDDKERVVMWAVRNMISKIGGIESTEKFLDLLTKTKSNSEFLDKMAEALKK